MKNISTLDSIIAAEGVIANVVGMTWMNPPVKDLCELIYYAVALATNTHYLVPRMMPILCNRHEDAGGINKLDLSY